MTFCIKHKLNSNGAKSDYLKNVVANTRALTRIITYLRNVKESNRKKIFEATGIEQSKLADALNWLVSNNLITKKISTKFKTKIYKLNENFLKL